MTAAGTSHQRTVEGEASLLDTTGEMSLETRNQPELYDIKMFKAGGDEYSQIDDSMQSRQYSTIEPGNNRYKNMEVRNSTVQKNRNNGQGMTMNMQLIQEERKKFEFVAEFPIVHTAN